MAELLTEQEQDQLVTLIAEIMYDGPVRDVEAKMKDDKAKRQKEDS